MHMLGMRNFVFSVSLRVPEFINQCPCEIKMLFPLHYTYNINYLFNTVFPLLILILTFGAPTQLVS